MRSTESTGQNERPTSRKAQNVTEAGNFAEKNGAGAGEKSEPDKFSRNGAGAGAGRVKNHQIFRGGAIPQGGGAVYAYSANAPC
jgi:hypothetical protein